MCVLTIHSSRNSTKREFSPEINCSTEFMKGNLLLPRLWSSWLCEQLVWVALREDVYLIREAALQKMMAEEFLAEKWLSD